jgi:hypothetical protein
MGVKIKNLLLVLILGIVLSPLSVSASGDVTGCTFPQSGDGGIMCNYTGGEPLLLKKYNSSMVDADGRQVGVSEYTAKAPDYNAATKTGDYFIVHIQDGTSNATIDKINDQGTKATYVYSGKKISVAGKNPVDAKANYTSFMGSCSEADALTCWIANVFVWAQGAILLLATGSFIAAGLIWMTSTGDPKRLALAKKLITGALSGIAVIVLGRFFLTRVVGVPWL